MGYLAVKTLVSHIKGQPVEKRIDTGVHIATRDNMNEPAMKELLKPDLSQVAEVARTPLPQTPLPTAPVRDAERPQGVRRHQGRQWCGLRRRRRRGLCARRPERAGKSTLMGILSGAIRPDAGTMILDGGLSAAEPIDARRAGVAMIHQELSLAPHLTVMENIALGVEPARLGLIEWRRMRDAATDALTQLGIRRFGRTPSSRISRRQGSSSWRWHGLRRGARVVVLDEPTSSLTHADVERLFALIRRLKSQGLAIVYISHFIEEVKAISDRVVVLRDGANAGGGRTADLSPEMIVERMVGREVEDLYPRTPRWPRRCSS